MLWAVADILIQIIDKIFFVIADTNRVTCFDTVFFSIRALVKPVAAKFQTVLFKRISHPVGNSEYAYFAVCT